MSERKPDDVIEKCATVVRRTIAETGNEDAGWHWGVVLEELHRARESEEMLEQQKELLGRTILGLEGVLKALLANPAEFAAGFSETPRALKEIAALRVLGLLP